MTDSLEQTVSISDSAVKQIRNLTSDGEFKNMRFRIAVSGGGCSGFQYAFSFDDDENGDDRVIERDGVAVLIDEMSWDYIVGSELHFAEELVGSFFTMRNPNAASTCGCGVSFSIG
ncbi:MAG: iron-sulfur cluster insertion protein ErpA [Rhodospirillaceae bacterium]|nr:iron-sulfur cluster insertion protein ErpA [Rhodospirillaceae bacterium]|tara:strand:- start:19340 stop:19687 length:348 start_codon:yes stop_codon:yes gene_type:complete